MGWYFELGLYSAMVEIVERYCAFGSLPPGFRRLL